MHNLKLQNRGILELDGYIRIYVLQTLSSQPLSSLPDRWGQERPQIISLASLAYVESPLQLFIYSFFIIPSDNQSFYKYLMSPHCVLSGPQNKLHFWTWIQKSYLEWMELPSLYHIPDVINWMFVSPWLWPHIHMLKLYLPMRWHLEVEPLGSNLGLGGIMKIGPQGWS